MFASCRANQIPYRLLSSVRGWRNDKNNGVLVVLGNEHITEGQRTYHIDPTNLKCKTESFSEPCTMPQRITWKNWMGNRIRLVNDPNKWYILLLVDDDETIIQYEESVASGYADIEDYGQILRYGSGKNPPTEVKQWVFDNYGMRFL